MFPHNVIIHPLMVFLPKELAYKLHDINGLWAFTDQTEVLK